MNPSDQQAIKPVCVLITGSGVSCSRRGSSVSDTIAKFPPILQAWSHPNWGDFPNNTSSLSCEKLDGIVIQDLPPPPNDQIKNPVPVKVTYRFVPTDWLAVKDGLREWIASGGWDAIINVGEHPETGYIRLEPWGPREGFEGKDVRDMDPPGGGVIEGTVDRFYSAVDCDGLAKYMPDSLGFKEVKTHDGW